jgi:hypothetical protein
MKVDSCDDERMTRSQVDKPGRGLEGARQALVDSRSISEHDTFSDFTASGSK